MKMRTFGNRAVFINKADHSTFGYNGVMVKMWGSSPNLNLRKPSFNQLPKNRSLSVSHNPPLHTPFLIFCISRSLMY